MMVYRDLPQKSQAWFDLRRGRVCSSDVSAIIDDDGNLREGRTKGEQYSQGVRSYVAKLVAERASGYVAIEPDFQSSAMMYGLAYEAAARAALEMETGYTFTTIGGILSECGRWWCSSDGVAFDDAGIDAVAEIKIPTPKTQVTYLLDESLLLAEYKAQLCCEMLVSGSRRGLLFSYGAGLNARRVNVLCEVWRDDPFIVNLRVALETLDELVIDALEQIGASTELPKAVPYMSDREWFDRNFSDVPPAAAQTEPATAKAATASAAAPD